MTDFFSSLVDRALDRMPVLQRRRPSLFEPSTGMVSRGRVPSEPSPLESEQEIVFEVESSGRERTVVDLSSTALKLDSESIRSTSPAANMENAQAAHPRNSFTPSTLSESEARQREHKQSPAPLTVESRVKPAAREETEGRASPHRESAAALSFAAAPLQVTETIVEREVETPGLRGPSERLTVERIHTPPVTQPASSPTLKPVVAQATEASTNGEKKLSSLPDKKVESQIPIEPRQTVRKELLRPITGPRLPPSRRSQLRAANTLPSEPTVQVTIGRIEVRATPPASPMNVARPAAPKMSLEDYLKTRSGGNK